MAFGALEYEGSQAKMLIPLLYIIRSICDRYQGVISNIAPANQSLSPDMEIFSHNQVWPHPITGSIPS